MSRSTQTWRHSERGAVAGLRLLGIGLVLLAVAAMGINLVNSDKKSSTPTPTTTKPPATTTKPPTTTTKPSTTTATSITLPLETLKCDNQKYALVRTPDSPGILPTDLRKTAETSGRQALIVSARLCDAVGAKTTYGGPPELIFIGPFDSVPQACDFEKAHSSQSQTGSPPEISSGGGVKTDPIAVPETGSAEGLTDPDWEVHNIRNLTGDPQSCEGN